MRIIKISLFLCSWMMVMLSCETDNLLDANIKTTPLDSSSVAFIKFTQLYAGNTPQLPTAANLTTGPQVFLYANGKKITGSAVGFGGFFPVTSVYAAVEAGTNVRFDVIQARMNLAVVPNIPAPIAGDTLKTFNQTLEKGKFYTILLGDSVPNFNTTVKEDVLNVPGVLTYKIRLANWFMNPTDTLNVYSRREGREVITGITHKQFSDWVEIPVPVISDTMDLRRKGTTTSIVGVGFSPAGTRMYTIVGRGKTGVSGKALAAALIVNR